MSFEQVKHLNFGPRHAAVYLLILKSIETLRMMSILNKLFDILEYVQVQLHCHCLPKGFRIFSLQPETKQENNE
jgi:hypothetical protein